MNLPLVSIIIPTYNRPEELAGALECIRKQTYPYVEAIVVDDGSADANRTSDVCTHARIKGLVVSLHGHVKNRGLHAALNTGLAHISGEFVGQLADDDRLYPFHVWALLTPLLAGSLVAHSNFRMRYRRKLSPAGSEWEDYAYNDLVWNRAYNKRTHCTGTNMAMPSLLWSRALADVVGAWDTEQAFGDLDMMMRLASIVDHEIAHVPLVTGEVVARAGGEHYGQRECVGERGVENIRKLWTKHPTKTAEERVLRESTEQFVLAAAGEEFVFAPTRYLA